MGLRKGQKELVEQYREGYCAVTAIPGGGKTHCLSVWAAEMISRGLHKPGKILIVTYMNSAVNNFKQRISSELQLRGITGSRDYCVSTIHGLCLQIIREKPDLLAASEEFEIIDDVSRNRLMNMAIEEWRGRNEGKFRQYLEESKLGTSSEKICRDWQDKLCSIVSYAIGCFKCRGMNPIESKEKCRVLPGSSMLKVAAEVYEIYGRLLERANLLDFHDMLYNAENHFPL